MTAIPKIIFILIPLKILQVKQSEIINQLLNKKTLVLNSKNNRKHIYKQATKRYYTYIFISLKIFLSKKFKKNIFDDSEFTDKPFLLAIDEIHLDDQWKKAFRPLYANIEKV